MAILAKVTTKFGEDKELYIRLNNIEATNHGVMSIAKFRGFLSKEAFENGMHYVHEEDLTFSADVSLPLWEQAYIAIKLKYSQHQDA